MTTGKPIIVYNEDSDNMMTRRWHADPEHYTEQEIRDYIASVIAGGQVTHFFFCVDARASAYPSKVFDNYWDCLDDPEVEPDQRIRPMKDLMYSQGAQGAYFFNLFCEPVDKPDLEKYESWDLILHEGFTPENLARHPKSIPPNAPRECVMGGWC